MSSTHLGASGSCSGASSGPLMARGGAPVVRGTTAPVPSEKAAEPPPAAASALARAAEDERGERGESWGLCSALLAVAIGWLAWSQPSPSAGTVLFVALCLILVLIEYRRAGARFRSAIAAAGVAHGLSAGEAAREAWRHDAAFREARAAGESTAGGDAERS
ncbi:hypothetical protein BE15_02155 [Sorangium cellulosum]|uniref:Uncharacterized protein n=1 Tax=Sorangium cellulosum TaxID=56 RepID=A0A150QQD6_SORCE|nr:hypothetical protein BE15_02155 [Sorangium cellulosum]